MDEEEIWKNVLVAKYGAGVLRKARLDQSLFGNGCSPWWNDLCRLDSGIGWFEQVAVKKMGCADPIMSYGILVGCGGNKKIRKSLSIVWMDFVWVLWRVRNDRVFNNVDGSVEDVIERIQRISWQWYLHKTTMGSSLLYEWIWDPGDCMHR
ncbi:hypothetical protein TSUD_286010 [Trifolium subterraneum]|uniref:Reverse transcriptase zinc-binding domain-containing protein n=1 Tax=Trifolium subterraneum TaxID=3900 RepID=A0A2Z6NRN0_TRISU|nr:hypothetical protein TSUD_286010 [Trifolium subterraneum]